MRYATTAIALTSFVSMFWIQNVLSDRPCPWCTGVSQFELPIQSLHWVCNTCCKNGGCGAGRNTVSGVTSCSCSGAKKDGADAPTAQIIQQVWNEDDWVQNWLSNTDWRWLRESVDFAPYMAKDAFAKVFNDINGVDEMMGDDVMEMVWGTFGEEFDRKFKASPSVLVLCENTRWSGWCASVEVQPNRCLGTPSWYWNRVSSVGHESKCRFYSDSYCRGDPLFITNWSSWLDDHSDKVHSFMC